jgi:hypothetical protein
MSACLLAVTALQPFAKCREPVGAETAVTW